jgi:hypothetical protein
MPSTRALVRGASTVSLVAILLSTSASRAQAPASANDKVAAEALFEDGRRLASAGNFAEACPKFADSQRLDPSAGTLLNLASCYEKLGRSATAWATYREAASVANAMARSEYVATAQRHAEALAPRLAHLTVSVTQPVDGLVVLRDGAHVERSEWGVAIPIDSGAHTIEASAPGHKPWTSQIDVASDGAQASVSIPPLEALPVEAAPPPPPPVVPVQPPLAPPPSSDVATDNGTTQRVLGLVLGGVGVVGLGVGAGLAASAKSQYNTSLTNCQPGSPDACNGTGVSQRDSARSAGNAATVAISVGAAALVGGAIVWFTAPRSSSVRVGIAPTLGGGVFQGVW